MGFKFFQDNTKRVFTDYMDQMDDYFLGGIPTTIQRPISRTQLRSYHNMILVRYLDRFNIRPGQANTNYHDARRIHAQVNEFINSDHITTYDEIRWFYDESYRGLSNGENIISDEDHMGLIMNVTRTQ